MARIFITGGTGCIGAATVFQLIDRYGDQIEQILIATRNSNRDQLKIWFGPSLESIVDKGKLKFAAIDISDKRAVGDLLGEFAPTHIIHLGALQSPACDADPELGVEVNLTGTMNLFHIARGLETPIKRFVFASSGAVYGKRSMYPESTIAEHATLAPPNLYGVWKVAGEHLAALFHEKTGTPTVSLRLNTTFGPGRDQGLTSAPTRVIKALAFGANCGKTVPCQMPYHGRENYHYVEDVGAHFAGATMLPFEGCQAFNIKGRTIAITEFLELVAQVAAEQGIQNYLETGITPDAKPNLFICDLNDQAIDSAFPGLPRTDIATGIRKSLSVFMAQAEAGILKM